MKRYRCLISIRWDFTADKVYTLLGRDVQNYYLFIDNNDNVKRFSLSLLETCFEEVIQFKYGK